MTVFLSEKGSRRLGIQTFKSRRQCEDRGQDWITPITSQGSQGLLGEKHEQDFPSESPEGTIPADTLILDFGLQNWERINFRCFKPHQECCCYSSPKALTCKETNSLFLDVLCFLSAGSSPPQRGFPWPYH